MDINRLNETVNIINCALKLERRITGVKFLFDEAEYNSADAKKITGKIPYCVMVKAAMSGNGTKAAAENFGCNGAAKALGVVEPGEISLSGRFYNSLGLYRDLTISKNVQGRTTFCSHKIYGVMVKPVEQFNVEPDIILIAADSYNAMRIIQGFTYSYGFNTAFKISGNQAVCSECTAFPFESNNINVSLLCSGTRFKAGWNDSELMIGFPYNRFQLIADGVLSTLDPVEPNEKKSEIKQRFNNTDLEPPEITFNRNYYTGLNKD
jgi:uncharacterized protein (DUF169 family)